MPSTAVESIAPQYELRGDSGSTPDQYKLQSDAKAESRPRQERAPNIPVFASKIAKGSTNTTSNNETEQDPMLEAWALGDEIAAQTMNELTIEYYKTGQSRNNFEYRNPPQNGPWRRVAIENSNEIEENEVSTGKRNYTARFYELDKGSTPETSMNDEDNYIEITFDDLIETAKQVPGKGAYQMIGITQVVNGERKDITDPQEAMKLMREKCPKLIEPEKKENKPEKPNYGIPNYEQTEALMRKEATQYTEADYGQLGNLIKVSEFRLAGLEAQHKNNQNIPEGELQKRRAYIFELRQSLERYRVKEREMQRALGLEKPDAPTVERAPLTQIEIIAEERKQELLQARQHNEKMVQALERMTTIQEQTLAELKETRNERKELQEKLSASEEQRRVLETQIAQALQQAEKYRNDLSDAENARIDILMHQAERARDTIRNATTMRGRERNGQNSQTYNISLESVGRLNDYVEKNSNEKGFKKENIEQTALVLELAAEQITSTALFRETIASMVNEAREHLSERDFKILQSTVEAIDAQLKINKRDVEGTSADIDPELIEDFVEDYLHALKMKGKPAIQGISAQPQPNTGRMDLFGKPSTKNEVQAA
jgi:hypothetical protein